MDESMEQAKRACAVEAETADRDLMEDELQEALDDKVADALLGSELEVETSETEEANALPVSEAIVQQTIEAEENLETLDTRVLRDFDDGVIVFDGHGVIRYINPSASRIMGLKENNAGRRYRDVFGKKNDALLDFLVMDSLEKNATHRGDVLFHREDGSTARLNMGSICMQEDGKEPTYVIHFDDITEMDTLRRKRRESSAVFIGTMTAVSIWTYVVALWQKTGETVSPEIMTQFIHAIALVMFFYIRKQTSFTWEEMGFRTKGIGKAIRVDVLMTVIGVALLFGVKLILMKSDPVAYAGKPFWDWSRMNWSDFAYPFTVVLQEFLSRGVIHENLRRIFVGKHSEVAAIIVSSLMFGAMHLHRGFMYMLAATALLSIFGILYRKQGTIWGLCIPHFVLGEVVWYLGFV